MFVDSAKGQLLPRIDAVLQAFDAAEDPRAVRFFTGLRGKVQSVGDELGLANLFLELATAAFLGFAFNDEQSQRVDELLAAAEDIAHALTAPDNPRH